GKDDDDIELKRVPDHVRVYEISGPMFFGMTDLITQVKAEENTRVFIIRMRAVPALDASAMHSLEDLYKRCQKKNIGLVFSHVNEQPMRTMVKAGFAEKLGEENFCRHIDDALERAAEF
ncbi:MAG: sodium-independent anion transporter, partial [Lachnospiraceae bacterium]|nr:sodium-independent anion transporter [Lachnospiraceae bacterium]